METLVWRLAQRCPLDLGLKPLLPFPPSEVSLYMALGPQPCIMILYHIEEWCWTTILLKSVWLERLMKGLYLVCGFGHCLPLCLSSCPFQFRLSSAFFRLCVPACCTCSCCLPSITAQLTPFQVPSQHVLIAFLVLVMLQAALLLAIHHPAIVAVSCLSHMTSPAKCARRECQWAGRKPGWCCPEFINDLKNHR